MVTSLLQAGSGWEYFLSSSFSLTRNRFGTELAFCTVSFSFFLTSESPGSPRISPRSQRLLVIQEFPFEKVRIVRLQWFVQNGQGAFAY